MHDLPTQLWRVTWDAAVGWPEPEHRQRTARNYSTLQAAGRQLAIIDSMPTHLSLVSVHTTLCSWFNVNEADVPRPAVLVDTNEGDTA